MPDIKTFSLVDIYSRVDATHNNPFAMLDVSLVSRFLVPLLLLHNWCCWVITLSPEIVLYFITQYSTVHCKISKVVMPYMRVTFEIMRDGVSNE